MLKHKCFLLLCISLLSYSCKDDKAIDNTVNNLQIKASVSSRSVTTKFIDGNDMRLFVKVESDITSDDYVSDITATYGDTKWTLSKDVNVQNDVFVYAVAPAVSATSASDVNVDINQQMDLLYSNDAVKATSSSPVVTLSFHHALSILGFNIARNGYSGDGILTSITISGNDYYTSGKLDVGSGNIKVESSGTYTSSTEKEILEDGWVNDSPQFFSIPFNSKGENINVDFVIDDEKYSICLPEQVIEKGMKYVFRFILSDSGIALSPEGTEIISLDTPNSEMASGEMGKLKFIVNSDKVALPNILSYDGNNVIGKIQWGDDSYETYAYPMEHNYETTGEYEVIVNMIGGSVVELHDFSDIEEIDFSEF